MALIERIRSIFATKQASTKPDPMASYVHGGFSYVYNGEKNLGEAGPIKKYMLGYESLRLRSWQAFLDSEIAQTVIGRYCTWMIGPGLKLQAEPSEYLLGKYGISIKNQDFSEHVEALFTQYSNSKRADYCKMRTLNRLAKTVYKNAIVGGDVLVVLRFDGKNVTSQLIDGAHIKSPLYGTDELPYRLNNGNTIRHGVECDASGMHVAYHVKEAGFPNQFKRIPARSTQNGLQIAFLVYGLEYRLDNVRGIPLISAVMETVAKLDRYKEATVASAEEISKIVYTIEHQQYSTGESPLTKQLAAAFSDSDSDQLPETLSGEQLANKVASTTNKQTYNMPVGSSLKQLENKNQIYFKDFYTVNIDLVCATMQIPPDVAMSKYGESYSASRAAIKDWEHTLNVNRKDFSEQFYNPVYEFWLDVQILMNKVQAPGYINARAKKDDDILECYRTARFVGPSVPFIDPVKEVEAARRRLGDLGASIPLSTVEQECETLNTGDSDANIKQFILEYQGFTGEMGLEVPPSS